MRQHDRHSVSISAMFKTSDETVVGTVVDISMGGVGMETVQPVATGAVGTLDLYTGSDKITVPCSIRHSRELWGRQTLHVQFAAELSQQQHDAIDNILRQVVAGPQSGRQPRRQARGGGPRSQPRRTPW